MPADGNDLRIRRGGCGAEQLAAKLVELPEPACLGTLVPEAGGDVAGFQREGVVEQAFLDGGPNRSGSALRLEGKDILALLGLDIELLLL